MLAIKSYGIPVHEPGEEFWLWDLMSPFKLASHTIPNSGTVHIMLTKTIVGTEKGTLLRA